MTFKIIYASIKAFIERNCNRDAEVTRLKADMNCKIQEILSDLKINDINYLDTSNPKDKDIILYLIYLLGSEEQNYLNILNNLESSLIDKSEYSVLTTNDIKTLIQNSKNNIRKGLDYE